MWNEDQKRRESNRSPSVIRHSFIAAFIMVFSAPAALAQEWPAQFVDAAAIVPGLMVEMRYAGGHNFVGRPIDGYEAPRCLLTQTAAAALAAVARDLAPRGLLLKVFDCYRPTRAVADFVRWAHDLSALAGKTEFYPAVDKRDTVPGRLYRRAFRPFARFDRRRYACADKWARAGHGHAFRFF